MTHGAELASSPWLALSHVGLRDWRVYTLSLAVIYAAYQKRLLPERMGRIVGRVSFYPTWPFTFLSRRHDYWTLVDSHVFLGAAPMRIMSHVTTLHARGVRAVINLCDEYSGPVTAYRQRHIKQLRLPTVDHMEPSLADLEEAVAFIERNKQEGVRVYVHCKSGNGRSAAVVFCWLLHARGMTLLETQDYLNEKRRVRKKLYLQPNINAFYEKLQQRKQKAKTSNI